MVTQEMQFLKLCITLLWFKYWSATWSSAIWVVWMSRGRQGWPYPQGSGKGGKKVQKYHWTKQVTVWKKLLLLPPSKSCPMLCIVTEVKTLLVFPWHSAEPYFSSWWQSGPHISAGLRQDAAGEGREVCKGSSSIWGSVCQQQLSARGAGTRQPKSVSWGCK